ncbi:MAG: DUF4886 domain-containing protein [Clostridia bacterium]|nr:DUF4886 domain-containing protein [Clostridia bacterium]
MLKILALGNSFSQDTTTYIDKMTDDLYVRNLYIGGCSLERHYKNLTENLCEYELQKNGKNVNEGHVTANEVISSEKWDVITIQQLSIKSGKYESFYPYLDEIIKIIGVLCPTAKIVLHETWAYASYCTRDLFAEYDYDQKKMYDAIKDVFDKFEYEQGYKVIRCGSVIQKLRESGKAGEDELCRDGFHLSLDYGRFIAGAVWLKFFNAKYNGFIPENTDQEKINELLAFI